MSLQGHPRPQIVLSRRSGCINTDQALFVSGQVETAVCWVTRNFLVLGSRKLNRSPPIFLEGGTTLHVEAWVQLVRWCLVCFQYPLFNRSVERSNVGFWLWLGDWGEGRPHLGSHIGHRASNLEFFGVFFSFWLSWVFVAEDGPSRVVGS